MSRATRAARAARELEGLGAAHTDGDGRATIAARRRVVRWLVIGLVFDTRVTSARENIEGLYPSSRSYFYVRDGESQFHIPRC